MPSKRNTAILILGMHRSGTSATAGTLYHLGVSLGKRLLSPDGCNERGYFESHNVLQFNHDLLAALGYTWDDPRELPPDWEASAATKPFRARLREIIEADFAQSPLWGVKDPRICRLLPLWLPALHESGARTVVVFVLRNPMEVAGSLIARSPEMTTEHAQLIWLRHNIEAELQSRELPRVSVDYARLIADWRGEVARIGKSLGINWPIRPEAATPEIDEFLGEDLNHQNTADQPRRPSGKLQPWLMPLYRCLQHLDNPTLESDIDEISRRVARPAQISARRCLWRRHGLLPRAARKLRKLAQRTGPSAKWRA